MRVSFYPEEDVITLIASPKGGGGGSLRDDFWIIFTADKENITRVEIHDASRFVPLATERGYNADHDTLSLGNKPRTDYRMIENGDFLSYRQWFDDGSEWDVVAIDLRNASKHLAPLIDRISP